MIAFCPVCGGEFHFDKRTRPWMGKFNISKQISANFFIMWTNWYCPNCMAGEE